jgi:hypothetical protein
MKWAQCGFKKRIENETMPDGIVRAGSRGERQHRQRAMENSVVEGARAEKLFILVSITHQK